MNEEKSCGHIVTDECDCASRKPLDVNKYATKKTIAQGMLDIALLTANASQLKYILQVGSKHEFYTLMLSLIVTSIILQVVIGVLLLSLNLMRDCRLHLEEYKTSATYINYVTTALSVGISAINLLISAFDPSLAQFASSIDQVSVGILFLVIGGLDIKRTKDQRAATILNDIILVIIFIISLINVVISSFGMEYTNNQLRLIKQNPIVAVGGLTLILTRMSVRRSDNGILPAILNHFALGLSLLSMVSDVVKMSFGLDPALSLQDFDRDRNITK